jgi:WD40 repeat protein
MGLHNSKIARFTQDAQREDECCSHKLRGQKNWVNCLAFSSGKEQQQQLLASGFSDNTVQLWDTHTRECVAVLKGHTSRVRSVAFSPNNRLLASSMSDGTVLLWDTHTNECVAVLQGHTGSVESVAFSPDSRLLASVAFDKTVWLWDVAEQKSASPMHVLQGHTSVVWSVSFSPDGWQLASASEDCTVRLWGVPEGVPGLVLQHARHVTCVAFSPVVGSNMLASGSNDFIVRLWDVNNQQVLHELHGHVHWMLGIAFSPDGSQLVSGSYDKTVRLWRVASGKLLKVLTEHSNTVLSVAFHPNGKQVASCSYDDATVIIWTVCEWSDRTHQLFGNKIKRLVFCLMCIKQKIDFSKNSIVPNLPMALWLDIFAFLC